MTARTPARRHQSEALAFVALSAVALVSGLVCLIIGYVRDEDVSMATASTMLVASIALMQRAKVCGLRAQLAMRDDPAARSGAVQ